MTKPSTKKQRALWERLREFGCIICGAHAEIHHCGTGMGGRKDHDKVIPLSTDHHTGKNGIHTVGRPIWQLAYGTEAELMGKIETLVAETGGINANKN